MRTAFSTTSLAFVFAAILALPACVTDTTDTSDQETTDTFLYGLSEAEVTALLPLASSPMTLEAWLDFHRGEFDCAAFGDMCDLVGPDAAFTITERSYHMGLEGATREAIDAFLAEELDAASITWKAAHGGEHDDLRDSAVSTDTGSANDERVRTEVFAIKPAVGSWNIHTDCTYQRLSWGVWGGSASANLTARIWGHLHTTSGTIYDSSGTFTTATIFAHSIDTAKHYFYPDTSTDDLHGFGECDASLGGWSASAGTNVNNN